MHWQKLDCAFVALKCANTNFPDFFSLMLAAKGQGSLYIGAFVALKCNTYQISRFCLSRLTQAAKTQAGLCIGISSTEPSFLENAITVHCEIFQIKHWNISIKGNKNLFSTENTQSEHLFRACTACPDTKIKILNHGPREP